MDESETREAARRAYQNNPRLSSVEIARAVGRSRQTIDLYVAYLRAVAGAETDIKIFRLHILGFSQERIAKITGLAQKTIHNHSVEMPALAFLLNTDLKRGFTVPQVAEKHGWPEPLVWAIALEGKDDIERLKTPRSKLRRISDCKESC